MQDENRMSFSDRVAVGLVLGFGVLLVAGILGGVEPALMVAYCAITALVLTIAWRAMRAHERLADAVEKLARQKDKEIK